MEQPIHDLRAGAATTRAAPRRVGALVIVGIIHVFIIYALVSGLASTLIEKMPQEIKAQVVQEKIPDKTPPPPPPPDMKQPPPPFVPTPDIVIETPAASTTAITTQNKVATPQVRTELHGINRTHTIPPYPDVSKRLGEQGTVILKVVVGTDGSAQEVTIQKSSGSDRLDQQALAWVKEHWKWQPPTTNGKPSSAITLVGVKFDLRNQ